jgi:hypothetical protein
MQLHKGWCDRVKFLFMGDHSSCRVLNALKSSYD